MSIDLTTVTEVDPNSRLSTTTTTSSFAGLANNETAYQYLDYGAGYFQKNFSVEGDFQLSAGAVAGRFCISFANSLGEWDSNDQELSLQILIAADDTYLSLYPIERNAGSSYSGTARATTLAKFTRWYYRISRQPALGAKGGLLVQIYSDAACTTLVHTSAHVISLTDYNYQYFYPVQSYNYANAATATGDHGNITATLNAYTAGLDLTAFTETDVSADLTVFADCISVSTMAANINSYVYKDGGVGGYAGNYILESVVNLTAISGASARMGCLMLSNTVQGSNGTADLHAVIVEDNGGSTYRVKLREYSGAAYDSTTIVIGANGTPAWLKVWRDVSVGTYGTLYLAAYSDPERQTQKGSTVSLTLHENIDFQYLMALSSYNGGSAHTITGTVGGVTTSVAVIATKGAFSWAGKTSALQAQSLSATVGAFTWAGKTSALSSMVQATKGVFSWAGVSVNLNTGGQVNTSPGTFSWGGKSSPLSFSISATVGAFSWAGKSSILGATVTSLRTATLTKWDTATSKEIPDTGLSGVLYMLYNPTTGLVYDFSDNTFKASASCTTPQGTMTERTLLDSGGTNLTPGIYDILLSTTGLSGLYQEYLFYYGTTNHLNSNPVRFQDGIEYLGGLTSAENITLNAIPADVLAAATATPIAADIKKVNAITVQGAGTPGNSMRPA